MPFSISRFVISPYGRNEEMSSKADHLALRVILVLVTGIGLLFVIRSWIGEMPSLAEMWPAPKARSQVNTASLYTTGPIATPGNSTSQYRPPIAQPVWKLSPPSPALPRRFSLRILPRQWSAPIDLPEGRTVFVTFKLGRIRIERNGIDEGICFRQPLVSGGPAGQLSLHPFSVLMDKTPRTIAFGAGTRTLRFMSGESETGQILVEFK
jgi:hypothetical protein